MITSVECDVDPHVTGSKLICKWIGWCSLTPRKHCWSHSHVQLYSQDGNGNGRFKRVDEETPRMETGDRQYVPLDKGEASLLTTPVPGDPTQIHNHTAP